MKFHLEESKGTWENYSRSFFNKIISLFRSTPLLTTRMCSFAATSMNIETISQPLISPIKIFRNLRGCLELHSLNLIESLIFENFEEIFLMDS
jgi:hypothetical protein